ncbi:Ankyrin repeat domain-containing protein, partial [Tetrabaena socialis]
HQQQEQQQPGAAPDATDEDPSRVWLPEVVHHFAGFLGGNELACTLRLVNKATAAHFRGPAHTTVRLSLPVPNHAFARRWGGADATRSLTIQQRKELPCLTARSGSIANLEVLLARDDLTSPLTICVCRWLWQQGCRWGCYVLVAAAAAGHKAVCEWLHDEGCSVDELAVASAARGGHVGLMDWVLARTADASEPDDGCDRLLEAVAAGCDLPTLQRLHHTYLDSRGEELLGGEQGQVLAAAAGSPTADWRDKVGWLEGRGYPRTVRACEEAAQRVYGRDRLEWLQQRGYPISASVACKAAEQGNTEALEFLLAQGMKLGEILAVTATRCAAQGGHLAILKVLHAHGARIDHHVAAAAAAAGGHLPVMAWLVEALGAATALTAGMYAGAARSGSAELLAWLHQHGCPWDASVVAAAASTGSEEQLEWLVERGCPMGENGAPYLQALENGDLAVLACLRRLGCPWGHIITHAIATCSEARNIFGPARQALQLLALTWLVKQGCPVDWTAAKQEAERGGNFTVLMLVRQLQPQPAWARGGRLRAAKQDGRSTGAGAGN